MCQAVEIVIKDSNLYISGDNIDLIYIMYIIHSAQNIALTIDRY